MSSAALARREALEQRFNGPIPRHLPETRTAAELEADQHRSMIRFARERIESFTKSLSEIQAWPDDAPGKAVWLANTQQIIDEHTADIARHEAALNALQPSGEQVAA